MTQHAIFKVSTLTAFGHLHSISLLLSVRGIFRWVMLWCKAQPPTVRICTMFQLPQQVAIAMQPVPIPKGRIRTTLQ